jgi:hypothetical protein
MTGNETVLTLYSFRKNNLRRKRALGRSQYEILAVRLRRQHPSPLLHTRDFRDACTNIYD